MMKCDEVFLEVGACAHFTSRANYYAYLAVVHAVEECLALLWILRLVHESDLIRRDASFYQAFLDSLVNGNIVSGGCLVESGLFVGNVLFARVLAFRDAQVRKNQLRTFNVRSLFVFGSDSIANRGYLRARLRFAYRRVYQPHIQ